MTNAPENKSKKNRQFETFEDRLVLSGQSIADFAIDPMINQHDQSLGMEIMPMLADTNADSGVDYIHDQYGFTGEGQTVAVIDSGIAWDHYALGGGYGTGYKVVGGWDFAENDADPYDDGSAGFHGTHVSGIVGSEDDVHTGVASGVDLVGLRVFNDQGQGYFSWVEQALQWVHDHRNDYEHPITTVNLSLGTDWNSDSNPDWAMLEDEFAQLEADGIFIAVSAGNSFQQYQSTGLSYPATSEYVVPVASHDANGQMSDFSQRSDRVIVAPGESIRSTVPDHLFGGSKTGQFLNASGTSMAAPYLAGASTLVREAFQFMGYQNITQDQIYDHFRATADQIWDADTQANYHKLNIANAIDSLVTDLHGDSLSNATQFQLQQNQALSGIIGQLDDADHFSFTAQQNGTVTLSIQATHDLEAAWNVTGAEFQVSGNQVTFDVQSGQQYSFSLGTTGGLGHYNIDVNFESSVNAIDWGTVASKTMQNIQVDGEGWYQVTGQRGGFFTVEALFAHNNGNVDLEIYDQSMNLLGSASSASNNERLDVAINAGDRLYIRAIGNNSDVDFKMTNLVGLIQGDLVVNGTDGADLIELNIQDGYSVSVNGTNYYYSGSATDSVKVYAHGGNDRVNVSGSSQNENAYVENEFARIVNATQTVEVTGAKYMTIYANGGEDQIQFVDSAGDDTMYFSEYSAAMTNSSSHYRASGFTRVTATATQGHDQAYFTGSTGNELFVGREDSASMTNGNRVQLAENFDAVFANGGGGFDRALAYDSAGNDQVTLNSLYVHMQGDGFEYRANGFRDIRAYSSSGDDQVHFNDAQSNDTFFSHGSNAFLKNGYFSNYAIGFTQITANAIYGGNDVAILQDTDQDDTFYGYSDYSLMVNASSYQRVNGFEQVSALAKTGGYDTAYLNGTSGDEVVTSNGNKVTMTGDGFKNFANGFEVIDVRGSGGNDSVQANGTDQVDYARFEANHAQLSGNGYDNRFRDFANVQVDTGAGADEVVFEQLGQSDMLTGVDDAIDASVSGAQIRAWGFSWLEAHSKDNEVSNEEIGAVDYLFELHGQWQ